MSDENYPNVLSDMQGMATGGDPLRAQINAVHESMFSGINQEEGPPPGDVDQDPVIPQQPASPSPPQETTPPEGAASPAPPPPDDSIGDDEEITLTGKQYNDMVARLEKLSQRVFGEPGGTNNTPQDPPPSGESVPPVRPGAVPQPQAPPFRVPEVNLSELSDEDAYAMGIRDPEKAQATLGKLLNNALGQYSQGLMQNMVPHLYAQVATALEMERAATDFLDKHEDLKTVDPQKFQLAMAEAKEENPESSIQEILEGARTKLASAYQVRRAVQNRGKRHDARGGTPPSTPRTPSRPAEGGNEPAPEDGGLLNDFRKMSTTRGTQLLREFGM